MVVERDFVVPALLMKEYEDNDLDFIDITPPIVLLTAENFSSS